MLNRHSIDTSVPRSTSRSTVGRNSTNFRSMHMSRSTLGRLSTGCWSQVDRVSTQGVNRDRSECRSSIDRDVDARLPAAVRERSRSHKPDSKESRGNTHILQIKHTLFKLIASNSTPDLIFHVSTVRKDSSTTTILISGPTCSDVNKFGVPPTDIAPAKRQTKDEEKLSFGNGCHAFRLDHLI